MVRVINNNLWSPIPWGWGCGGHICGGGNNWMSKMLGYQMLFNMFQNMGRCYMTPPQQQGGYSMGYNPYGVMGLQLGGGGGMPQNYEEYMAKAEEQQAYANLKSSWSEFKITKIGDRYYAYLKSDRTQRIEADTVDELMDGLNTYVDENPDKFKSKPAAKVEVAEVDDDDTAVDPAGSANGSDGAGNTPGSTTIGGTGGFKLPQALQGYEWKNYKNLSDKSGYANDMTLDALLEKLGLDKNDANRQLLRDANPNGIKNDKVADVNRLTVLVKKQAGGTGNPVGPQGWDSYGASNVTSRLSGVTTAQGVVDKLLDGGFGDPTYVKIKFTIDTTKKNQLIKDIIANNPNIFNNDATGTLKQGASLSGIVVPYVRALQDSYKATVVVKGTGFVSTKNNPNDKTKINNYITNSNKTNVADAVVDQLAVLYLTPAERGNLTQARRNRIIKDIIYLNPSCFTEQGAKAAGFNIDKLDYPGKTLFRKYCGLSATSTSSSSRT